MTPSDEVALAALLLSLAGGLLAYVRYRGRPQLLVGVPPSRREQEQRRELRDRLGTSSIAAGFRHRPDCLAAPFRDGAAPLSERQRARYLDDRLRCRRLAVRPDGSADVAVVFENRGGRIARDYSASVAFIPPHDGAPIQILDVATESLRLTGIYSSAPAEVATELRSVTAAPTIVAAYEDYLAELPAWGDAAFFSGTLEARMFELAAIRVRVPPDVGSFLIVYTLDCADGWLRGATLAQGCVVERAAR